MTDDIKQQMEVASLLPDRYYMILNSNDEDSFSMTAYDTTQDKTFDIEEIPAGMVALNGLIELLENDFDRVWDAGMARLSFISVAQALKFEAEEEESKIDKILERENNILKVDFGRKQ